MKRCKNENGLYYGLLANKILLHKYLLANFNHRYQDKKFTFLQLSPVAMNEACGMDCGPGSSGASRLRVERGWCKRQIEVWNRLAAHVWSETEHTKPPTCRRQINNTGWSPKRPAGEPFMARGWIFNACIKERLHVLKIQRKRAWRRLRSRKRHDKPR